jgi:hypothetical protein
MDTARAVLPNPVRLSAALLARPGLPKINTRVWPKAAREGAWCLPSPLPPKADRERDELRRRSEISQFRIDAKSVPVSIQYSARRIASSTQAAIRPNRPRRVRPGPVLPTHSQRTGKRYWPRSVLPVPPMRRTSDSRVRPFARHATCATLASREVLDRIADQKVRLPAECGSVGIGTANRPTVAGR